MIAGMSRSVAGQGHKTNKGDRPMSSDISIHVNHGDGYTSSFEVGNYTSNANPMLIAATGVSLGWFDGVACEKAIPILAHAHRELRRHPRKYSSYNPSNGWGDLESFAEFITRFYAMARLHRAGVISNWY